MRRSARRPGGATPPRTRAPAASATTWRWSRISAQPRRSRTSGGLRCSRRSRVSRRQNVTSGCWRRHSAAARTPCSAHAPTISWAKIPSATNSRAPARSTSCVPTGAVAADVVDRRHGPPGGWPARRSPGPPRRRATTAGRPSRPARRSRRGDQRERGVVAAAVVVVEPEHRQPGGPPAATSPSPRVRPGRRHGRRAEGGAPAHCAGWYHARRRSGLSSIRLRSPRRVSDTGRASRPADHPGAYTGERHARVVTPTARHSIGLLAAAAP